MLLDRSHPALVPEGEAVEIAVDCSLSLGDRVIGPGLLSVTPSRVCFRGATQSLSFPYPYMLLHAISREANQASIYIQFNLSEEDLDHYDDDEEEDEDGQGGAVGDSPGRPPADCRFTLSNPDQVEAVFSSLSRGAAAHPDNDNDSDDDFNVGDDMMKRYEDMLIIEDAMEDLGHNDSDRWEDPEDGNDDNNDDK